MRTRWERLGLRGRLALSFGAIVVLAFAVVFVTVRAQMSHEQNVINREEGREAQEVGATPGEHQDGDGESPIEDAQSDVEQTFILVGALALAAALLAGYLVAARAAAPLRRIAATATEVDAGDLSPRIAADPGAAAELRVLSDSFNLMLDRLQDAFARQRGFVSDASHELRSPLTAIRGQIEVLAREPDPDAADVRRVEKVTLAELARVERLVEEMLTLARLDEGVGPARRELDAARFLRQAVLDAPGGAAVGALAPGRIEADPEMLGRVVRNLVENARRHAGPDGTCERLLDPRRGAPAGRRRRRRPRHPARRARARLRPLPPQRRRPRPLRRRLRPRPGDRAGDRRGARRLDPRRGIAARRGAGQLRAAAAKPS